MSNQSALLLTHLKLVVHITLLFQDTRFTDLRMDGQSDGNTYTGLSAHMVKRK